MTDVRRPALEGSVAVRGDRRLSFAEYGSRRGPAIVWMHGTPGARRQIPLEARAYAERHGLRIIGVDRPGIGSSTPHLYPDLVDWTADLELLLDTLAVDTVRLIGLSGGGPYVLAAGAALPDRV
ncbi:MAG: alpha/beta fold hydrolase, partial [Nocardioides sp.]